MASPAVLATPPVMPILAQFTDQVTECRSPGAVLDSLNDLVSHYLPMSVLGAAHIPLKLSDWRSIRLGEEVFLHSSTPEGWWDEYSAMASTAYNPALMIARSCLMPSHGPRACTCSIPSALTAGLMSWRSSTGAQPSVATEAKRVADRYQRRPPRQPQRRPPQPR